jgi:hypothetical protein
MALEQGWWCAGYWAAAFGDVVVIVAFGSVRGRLFLLQRLSVKMR